MNKFRFNHEKTKKELGIEAHISTPSDLAQLLTQLLGIDKAGGKIIYDCCFGIGALSQYINTEKNILIGDDKEIKYLEQGQKNFPKAILFNHDAFQCSGPPCYQHLITPQWKEKVAEYLQQLENKLDEKKVMVEYQKIMTENLTPEQIQQELIEKEKLIKQKILELLIKKEAQNKENNHE